MYSRKALIVFRHALVLNLPGNYKRSSIAFAVLLLDYTRYCSFQEAGKSWTVETQRYSSLKALQSVSITDLLRKNNSILYQVHTLTEVSPVPLHAAQWL